MCVQCTGTVPVSERRGVGAIAATSTASGDLFAREGGAGASQRPDDRWHCPGLLATPPGPGPPGGARHGHQNRSGGACAASLPAQRQASAAATGCHDCPSGASCYRSLLAERRLTSRDDPFLSSHSGFIDLFQSGVEGDLLMMEITCFTELFFRHIRVLLIYFSRV